AWTGFVAVPPPLHPTAASRPHPRARVSPAVARRAIDCRIGILSRSETGNRGNRPRPSGEVPAPGRGRLETPRRQPGARGQRVCARLWGGAPFGSRAGAVG